MKKLLLLLCIVACYISGSAQTFTVSKSPMESGEQITVTGSGETDEAYFSSMTLITTGMTSTPDAYASNYVQITVPTEMNIYNPTTNTPSTFKIVITNSHPVVNYTITFQVKTTVNSTAAGSTPIPNVIKYVTVTVNKAPPVTTTYGNSPKSQVFYRNNCPTGYVGQAYTYSVSGGKYTSIISQADADAKAQADINTNGQNAANTSGTCKQLFYNAAITQNFVKNDCGVYATPGAAIPFTVPAAQFNSLISQADADAKAQAHMNVSGQANANINGSCVIKNTLTIAYSNQANFGAKVTSLKIKNSSGTVLYNFSTAQLIAGQEIPTSSSYTFVVTTTGSLTTWKSMELRFSATYAQGRIVDNDDSTTTYTFEGIDTTNSHFLQLFLYALYA